MNTEESKLTPYNISASKALAPPLSFSEVPYARIVHFPDWQEELSTHSHSCYKILFVEENIGWHQIGRRKISVMPGDLFLITPSDVHDPSGLTGTKNWGVIFAADILAQDQRNTDMVLTLLDDLLLFSFLQTSNLATGYYQVPPSMRSEWLARFQKLNRVLQVKSLGPSKTAHTILMLLVTDTIRSVAPELRQYSPRSRSLLVNVFRFIKAHYHQQISLCDVARLVDRSSAYLTDLVRRETGRTVLSWIIECRIAEARRLLMVTNLSIQDVGEAVGYLDAGHFIRQFRRVNGMTPQTWRQANQRYFAR